MLLIERKSLPNGSHRNQTCNFHHPFVIPEGWVRVPPALEAEAQSYLPFINLTFDPNNPNKLLSVSQGEIPIPELEPLPEPTETEKLRADIDYLAVLQGVELN